jgi:POB3-like N-terminal PH domain/Structure-specific recognition protein (SSRP1)
LSSVAKQPKKTQRPSPTMAGSANNNNNSNNAAEDDDVVVWKHIGFHGLAVGTLTLAAGAAVWKSAVTGRDDASTTRKLKQVQSASWTVFGKTGSLRLRCGQDNSNKDSKHQLHEWRLDGFPLADFDALKGALHAKFKVDLKVHPMSAAGTQYGISKVQGKLLKLNHCTLTDDLNEEGQEFEVHENDEIFSIDLNDVSQCVLPGNNRNEIELQFPESDTIEAGTDQLGACVCIPSFSNMFECENVGFCFFCFLRVGSF